MNWQSVSELVCAKIVRLVNCLPWVARPGCVVYDARRVQ
ncbi:hypothetical protein CXB40_09960 [Pseudomonas syringae pv. avii]|uniref:Uncharacterized protein n=1 Tax=Pseudomonas syringae pv. tomato (strain ATCC BAA-871 / DC3000) TaxID=223283 RepID=Q87YR4_PSESM|nr:hypothetical protein PSPTO_3728 [Pseudomonas syringae pv. tomato str. DC3000]MBW8024937.1 hypothetical protein [Pseudomonas syringae pv. tomato]MCF5224096.1 hypothetical protein [Pseudomonas syringae]POQ08453.1 hypothetical protein CXB40_09960 [Pseudomonas syringae pv. avii]PYD03749.1 hypothetical protein DND90_03650 [Pseudomonas syringae pv. maculicola]